MAKVGGGAAYQRLEVPKDGISQAMQFWGGQEAQRKAAENLAKERADVRKQKAISDWEEKYGLKEGDFENKYTGFQTFDDMNTDFSMDLTNKYVETQRAAMDALQSGNLEEKDKLQGELIKMKGMFKEASKSQEFFGTLFTDYKKAASEGKVSGASKEFEDVVQKAILEKNMALRYRDGKLEYTTIIDGVPKVIPYQDLMDGSFSWYEKQQVSGQGGLVDNVLTNLGTITKESTDGYYKITEQEWDDKIHGKAADEAIDVLVSSDEIMGDLLNQFEGAEKMFDFTDDERKTVRDKLKTMIKAGYSTKYEKDFNTGKYSADTRPKKGRDDDSLLSNLHNDANAFVSGDYTGLLGQHENEFGSLITIEDVIPAPNDSNSVIAVTSEGERITIPKTKRAFLEFKIGSKTEYKGLTPEKVMQTTPTQYREGTIGASKITDVINQQYSGDGKFVGEETPFVNRLKVLYPEAVIKEARIGENAIKVNGTVINLDDLSKDQVESEINKALGTGAGMTGGNVR